MAEERNTHYDSDRDEDSRESGGRSYRGSSGGRSSRESSGGRSRNRRFSRKRRWATGCNPRCPGYKGARVTYKQIDQLEQFVTERGKIRPRRQTGACAKHQRMLARAIKRARHMALLPYTSDHVFTSRDRR